MTSSHSLKDLKHYHREASNFFAAELMLLKSATEKITDERLSKASILLFNSGQTGTALLQLANQLDYFTSECSMLARSFIEKIINFCYVGICDDKEYRAFLLHPIYKHYHSIVNISFDEDIALVEANDELKLKKQEKLKGNPLVKEALDLFSETNPKLNWTKKSLNDRIAAIEKWGKMLDVFLLVAKLEYYSDASEALHGSLYDCTYNIAAFDPDFKCSEPDALNKKLYKDNSCILLQLGMLVHECFTLISYSNNITEIWNHSYKNRNHALGLWFHIIERKIKSKSQETAND